MSIVPSLIYHRFFGQSFDEELCRFWIGNLLCCKLREQLYNNVLRSQFVNDIVESGVGEEVQSKLYSKILRLGPQAYWKQVKPTSLARW